MPGLRMEAILLAPSALTQRSQTWAVRAGPWGPCRAVRWLPGTVDAGCPSYRARMAQMAGSPCLRSPRQGELCAASGFQPWLCCDTEASTQQEFSELVCLQNEEEGSSEALSFVWEVGTEGWGKSRGSSCCDLARGWGPLQSMRVQEARGSHGLPSLQQFQCGSGQAAPSVHPHAVLWKGWAVIRGVCWCVLITSSHVNNKCASPISHFSNCF